MGRLRIKDQDSRPDHSVGIVIGAAVLIWFVWLLWTMDTPTHAAQRDVTQVMMHYVCDDGHRFESLGATKSLQCTVAECTQRAWPVWTYQCSKHGGFVMQLRYGHSTSGPFLRAGRSRGRTWEEPGGAVPQFACSHCERMLVPDHSLRTHLLRPKGAPPQTP
jgi:hypothetical protein